MKPKININTLLIAILLAGGISFSIYGFRRVATINTCRDWPETQGVIMDSSMDLLAEDLPEYRVKAKFAPRIVYEYETETRGYFGDAISNLKYSFFEVSDAYYAGSEDEIAAFLAKYPVGSQVKVYYNPDNPAQAVLERGLTLPDFLPFIFGLLLTYAACHVYLFGNGLTRHRVGPLGNC